MKFLIAAVVFGMALFLTKECLSAAVEPRLVGEGAISTPSDETAFVLTPDGRTAFLARNSPTTAGVPLQVIYIVHSGDGQWSAPQVAPFSGQYRDFGPAMAPDGSKLFFISDRPVRDDKERDLNIWMVSSSNAWSQAQAIDQVNSSAQEYGVSVAANGTLYFGSTRAGGKGSLDIYRSRLKDGEYQSPENLGDVVNTAGAEGQPAISPDESTLVFTAFGRDDETVGVHREYNKGDLYVTHQRAGVWTSPRNCGPGINSGAGEAWPGFSSDGRLLFFSSERGFATYRLAKRLTWRELQQGLSGVLNGMGNIYQVDASVLGRE